MSTPAGGNEASALAALGESLLMRLSALMRTARTYNV